MVLEDLGVAAEEFLDLQKDAVQSAWMALDNIEDLRKLLKSRVFGSEFQLATLFQRLARLGLSLDPSDLKTSLRSCSPFVERLIHCVVNASLRDIKHGARISVPRSWHVVGVPDEGPAYISDKNSAYTANNTFTLSSGDIFGESQNPFSCSSGTHLLSIVGIIG